MDLPLCLLLLSSPVLMATKISDGRSPRICLLQKKFYHAETADCYLPLQFDGPCELGSWLVPTGLPGLAECVPTRTDLPEFCTPVLAGLTEVVCLEFLEESLYKTGNCSNGQILLPENFQSDSQPCPGSWSCRDNQTILEELFTDQSVLGDTLEWAYLEGLLCSPEKKLCLPELGSQSLVSTEQLEASLQGPRPRCQPNPCPPSHWPWLGEDGYYGCYRAHDQLQHCQQSRPLVLTKAGILVCGVSVNRAVASSRSGCRRNMVKVNGRCIPLYGG